MAQTEQSPGGQRRVMIDNCWSKCFPRGYDDNAVDDHDVQLVWLTTATGEAVDPATGTRSFFSLHDDRIVSIRYIDADVKFPIVSVSEAIQQGSWFVFGPGTQLMVGGIRHTPQSSPSGGEVG